MFKGNMSKLLKQAKDMQEQIEQAQSQLAELVIEADSGGGMVSVKVNGKQEIIELNIDSDAMSEDKEMLEDLIVAAVNQAIQNAGKAAEEKMNSITGGMAGKMKFPGM